MNLRITLNNLLNFNRKINLHLIFMCQMLTISNLWTWKTIIKINSSHLRFHLMSKFQKDFKTWWRKLSEKSKSMQILNLIYLLFVLIRWDINFMMPTKALISINYMTSLHEVVLKNFKTINIHILTIESIT